MRTFPDFEAELKAIDPRLTIVPNPNYPKLANIKLDNIDVCPIPNGDIREESDPAYTIEFRNGFTVKHKSRKEALDTVNGVLEKIKTAEGKEE